jgi:hypothetical protein
MFLSLRSKPLKSFDVAAVDMLLMQAARRASRPGRSILREK